MKTEIKALQTKVIMNKLNDTNQKQTNQANSIIRIQNET